MTVVLLAGAIAGPVVGNFIRAHAAPASSGALWATGHDADFHCANLGNSQQQGGGCNYFQVAVNFVRNGSPLKVLVLETHIDVAVGSLNVPTALTNAFGSAVPPMQVVSPRSTQFAGLPLIDSSGKPLYSAIIVASDVTCLVPVTIFLCGLNDDVGVTPDSAAINARAADIKAFFNAGGGILALSGADNRDVYYNFLPIQVTPIDVSPSNGAPGGFTLTPLGTQLGLTNSDINCCKTHSSFQLPASGSPLQVAEKDSAGNAETLIVRPSAPSPSRKQLVIFLQGINTSLTSTDINFGAIGVGLGSVGSIVAHTLPNATFLDYSYKGSDDKGNPVPYDCSFTFTNPIKEDISLLNEQIAKVVGTNQNTDIYLIGHSLGGVVAFGYLALLEEQLKTSLSEGVSLPKGAQLKAVVTLDSPLGGVRGGRYAIFSKFIATRYLVPGKQIIDKYPCLGLVGQHKPLTTVDDLVRIFQSPFIPGGGTTPPEDAGPDPQGSQASLLAISGVKLPFPQVSVPPSIPVPVPTPPRPLTIPSNEMLAEDAQTNLGTSFLSIGNTQDFLWNIAPCAPFLELVSPFLSVLVGTIPSFVDTQWLEDEGDNSALYGRSFTPAGEAICDGATLTNGLNHSDVLFDTNALTGLAHFLSPVGTTPSPLPINPNQPPE